MKQCVSCLCFYHVHLFYDYIIIPCISPRYLLDLFKEINYNIIKFQNGDLYPYSNIKKNIPLESTTLKQKKKNKHNKDNPKYE